ncbi:MAG TPA: sodium:proton antiporter [Dokdonella sp.]|uniref:cation:proton antiporter n=1 Tax=Dokdonella sp. TaxID=2291710 RepID=UPI002D80BEEB|nr:sodium:proton antiporter [Dokdonella sp.]HET9031825.1 sodium:proton antiporter [Dokdonella sp.]
MIANIPIPLALTGIVVLGVLAQWIAWRVRLPAIVLLLAVGIIVGPVLQVLEPDKVFGELLFPLTSLSVAIILFEGSLTLRFREIHGLRGPILNLVTLGAAINIFVLTAAAWYFLEAPIGVALLIGTIGCVTGPTVVSPMLRAIRPKPVIDKVLRWEGIIIDPIGAMLAVIALEFAMKGGDNGTWWVLGKLILSGSLIGAFGALLLGGLLKRHLVPWYLRNVVTLAVLFMAFTASNTIAHEAGLLAVTVMGVMLANTRGLDMDDVLNFKESLTVLLVSLLFIILAARLDLGSFQALGWGFPLFLFAVFFIARPMAVFASATGSKLTMRERGLIAWIGPRGIVAAAVASLFALRLEADGVPGGELLVPAIFSIIIASVLVQSFTARRLALRWKLAEEQPLGVIIVGSGLVPVTIGQSLKKAGYDVTLADSNWDALKRARMADLKTYFGSVVSDHAEHHLDTTGVARLLAMSNRPGQNTLACLHFRSELGTDGVFALRTSEDRDKAKLTLTGSLKIPWLFDDRLDDVTLEKAIESGAVIKTSKLKDNYTLADLKQRSEGLAIPLFAIDPKRRLVPFTSNSEPSVKSGWEIMALQMKPEHPISVDAKTPLPEPDLPD